MIVVVVLYYSPDLFQQLCLADLWLIFWVVSWLVETSTLSMLQHNTSHNIGDIYTQHQTRDMYYPDVCMQELQNFSTISKYVPSSMGGTFLGYSFLIL